MIADDLGINRETPRSWSRIDDGEKPGSRPIAPAAPSAPVVDIKVATLHKRVREPLTLSS